MGHSNPVVVSPLLSRGNKNYFLRIRLIELYRFFVDSLSLKKMATVFVVRCSANIYSENII